MLRLLPLLLPVHAHLFSSIPRVVPQRAGVINDSPTAGPWTIYELRLFFSENCEASSQITPFFTDVYDTGTHRETELFTNGQYVFDGAGFTNWTADCRVQLGGCAARTVSVGADIAYLAAFEAAAAQKDSAWNITLPLFEALTVKCFRIWQSSDPRYKCNDIGIVRGYPFEETWVYDVVVVFHSMSGGDWAQRPALFDTMWRVQNLEYTEGTWALSELEFYEDVLCTFALQGQAFSIGSEMPLLDADINAFDKNLSSVWTALCPDIPQSRAAEFWGDGVRFYGCEPEQAYIGLEFQEPSMVRCLRYFQKSPRDISWREQRRSWSQGLALQRWSGEDWFTTERFWDPTAVWDPVLSPTRATPFVGGAPASWEDLRPPSRSAWRLSNDITMREQWVVHELEFYTSENCEDPATKLRGTPIPMQGPKNVEVTTAFDGDARQDLGWTSSCTQGTGVLKCIPQEAWLGLYLREEQPIVKCFRVLQSKHLLSQAPFVSVGVYMNGHWQIDSLHREIGGGTWNRRPALPWTLWRIRNNEAIEGRWRVAEIKAYRDPLCLVSMTPGSPITSGYDLGDEPRYGMDEDVSSFWTGNCDESCNETRKYWIGMELPHDAVDVEGGELLVRCFRIFQSEKLEEQMVSTQVQIWNGEIYIISPITRTGSLHELGGGVWSRPASGFMTRWRLVPTEAQDRDWRVLELQLFADSRCSEALPLAGLPGGGETVLASSFTPLVTGFERAEMGKGWSEAQRLSDADTSTGVLIRHAPNRNYSRPGYMGVDYLSNAVWVRCIKLLQGSMPMEYVSSLRLELWDGSGWRSEDPELSSLEVHLEGLGGGGWQRRPAQPGSMWRLENAAPVAEGWAIYDLQLHAASDCQGAALQGHAIASGYAPPLAENGPEHGVDGNTSTVWMSQCCPVEPSQRPRGFELIRPTVGCQVGEAWIGVDLGAGNAVPEVKCVRIYQVGYELMQTSMAYVSKWDGQRWQQRWLLSGLGGSSWNQRPAAGNTMWRLLYKSRKDVPCPKQLARIVQRPWGIADLRFFADDACGERLSGGVAITSGGFDVFVPSAVDQESYDKERMLDTDLLSTWTANCRTGFYETDTDHTNCTGSWVGMQWSRAQEVRCVSIVQSRWESARCCDAADELELQRWNGSEWLEASWFRRPPVPAVRTEFNFRAPSHLGAEFRNVGACPPSDSPRRMFEEAIVEQRARRDSEKCIVQLTGAVTLLAEPYCITHPRCVEVFGNLGTCCPIGDLVQSENRCCCSFLGEEPIFADEITRTNTRDKLSFEYAAIWMSNVLPWLGLAMTIAVYLSAMLMPKDMEQRARAWVYEELERPAGRRRSRLLLRRLVVIAAWPLLAWRSFLSNSKTQMGNVARWFILPEGRLPKITELYRSLLFLIFGSILSSMAPWLLLGAILGEMMIWLALQLCQVIRYFKSPFDPLDRRDMQLRQDLSRVMVNQEDGLASAFEVAEGVATTIVYGLTTFGKFIFDLIIVRAQMLSMEAIENIEADKVVELFPGLLETLKEPAELIYQVMFLMSQLISWTLGMLVGIPLCEGSCALAGSVALVMILYGASQWLNYDLFGLFVASRQVVKATRPECQRILAQSLILLCLGASFAAVQMTMVLFTRALAFANPFLNATWVCAYDDTLAVFVGRILLTGSSLIGVAFVFLCVNGHFVGQDYITERVAKFLSIDLAQLDPDGVGEGGGWFRWEVFGAALPTLFGVWWDPWNIDAYLVRERAHVYSMELRDPQACKRCSKIHVHYDLMMTATGRTVSAAVQIVPYGAVVAKACEYLNDPPLIYIGNKMSCLKMKGIDQGLTHAKGTKNVLMWLMLFTASALAYGIEYLVPFLKRVASVGLLVYLYMGTFGLTEANLADHGTYVILAGFTLSFVKASLEKLIPALLGYGLRGVSYFISRASGHQGGSDLARTISGQGLSGACCATLVSGSCLAAGWASPVGAILVGGAVGYVFSLLTLLINVLFEQPSPDIDEEVPRSMFQLLMKLLASLLTGGLVALLVAFAGELGVDRGDSDDFEFQHRLGDRWTLRGTIGLCVLPLAVQFIVFRGILVENLRPKAKETIDPPYDWRDSPTWIVLRTVQFFPNFTAIPTCSLVTVVLREWVRSLLTLSPIEHQLIMTGAGVVVANVVALTVHRLLESFPQLVGFFATVFSAILLCPWNFLFGAFTAVWIGVALGSVLEEIVLRRRLQEEIRRREEAGEDDEAFFDTERAVMMEQWEQLGDSETVTEVAEEPTREEKLEAYLQIAAAGGSAIEYAREWEEQRAEGQDPLSIEGVVETPIPEVEDEQEDERASEQSEPAVLYFNAEALEDGSETSKSLSRSASRSSRFSRSPSRLRPEPRAEAEPAAVPEPVPEAVEAAVPAVEDEPPAALEASEQVEGLGGDGDQLRLAGLEELRLELERQLPTEPEPAVEPAVEPKGRRQDLELEDGFDFTREMDAAADVESKMPSKATTTPSMAQRPSPVAARVSPSAELHPEIRSMQRPPADLWSRTYDRQPTTTTSLRSMAQRTQQSLPRSGPASPASPASPARQKPRSSKR